MSWINTSLIIGDGEFTRWTLLTGVGRISVEHHDNCAAKTGRRFTCPKGWSLRGDTVFTSGVKLKAKTLDGAKAEATKRLRVHLAKVVQDLP